jgi:Primase C terminal 2 (PriCT-2)/Family of unknown function (DUF5906)
MEAQQTTHSQLIEITFGVKVSNAENLQTEAFHSLPMLGKWVRDRRTNISTLHSAVTTTTQFDELDRKLQNRIKTRGPYLTSGRFNGKHRLKENVIDVPNALIDLDEGNLSSQDIADKFGRYAHVAWETASSRADAKRWRVLLVLARPLSPWTFPHALRAFVNAIGLSSVDTSSERIAQPMLLPVIFDDYAPLVVVNEGDFLDLSPYIPANLPATPASTPDPADPDSDPFATLKAPHGLSLGELRALIEPLSSGERDWWRTVGMALHHETGGSQEGFNLWDRWSQNAPDKYDPDVCAKEWEGFKIVKVGKPIITIATVRALHKDKREATRKVLLADWKAKIDAASADDLQDSVIHDLRDAVIPLQGSDYATLARGIQKKLEVHGVKRTTDQIRGWITPPSVAADALGGGSSTLAEFAVRWAFITSEDKMCEITSGSTITKSAFDSAYDRLMPRGSHGRIRYHASEYVLKYAPKPCTVVAYRVYHPGRSLFFDSPEGHACINTWREGSEPARLPRAEWSSMDQWAVDTWEFHFATIFPAFERRIVLDWLSWIVQNPGDHPNWTLLIQGPHGIGKTLVFYLMEKVLGPTNVTTVLADALQDKFTGWAASSRLVGFEEVHFPAARGSSWQIVNKLKPFITNDVVSVRRMHTEAITVPNFTAYLMFTNHIAALPIEAGERRYCMIETTQKREAGVEAIRAEHPTYYSDLFEALGYAGALAEWLYTRPLDPGFNAKGHAPKTDALYTAQGLMTSPEEEAFTDLVSASLGCPPVISMKAIEGHLKRNGIQLFGPHSARLLRELGYYPMPGTTQSRMRIDGAHHHVYVHETCPVETMGSRDDRVDILKAIMNRCALGEFEA